MNNLYFVDYENLPCVSFEKVNPATDQVVIFAGKNQCKINIETVIQTQKLGSAVEWMKMEGSGRNALDFHIAYYLGHFTASLEAVRAKCNIYVVSKDGDYDILIKHIQSLGHQCQRLTALDPGAVALLKPVEIKAAGAKPADTVPKEKTAPVNAPATNEAAAPLDSTFHVYEDLVSRLKKIEKLKRPRTKETLLNHITAHYQKKTHGIDMEKVLNLLTGNKRISINNQRISYHF